MNGILINTEGDLQVKTGHLVIGECSTDIAERLLRAYPGEFKEYPTLGLFIEGHLNGAPDPFWERDARKQFAQAGIPIDNIVVRKDGITIVTKDETYQ